MTLLGTGCATLRARTLDDFLAEAADRVREARLRGNPRSISAALDAYFELRAEIERLDDEADRAAGLGSAL